MEEIKIDTEAIAEVNNHICNLRDTIKGIGLKRGARVQIKEEGGRYVEGFYDSYKLSTNRFNGELYLLIRVFKVKKDGTPSVLTSSAHKPQSIVLL